MSKVIRLSDSDLEVVNECIESLNKLQPLVDVYGFKPDVKFVISSALNCYQNYINNKLVRIKYDEFT